MKIEMAQNVFAKFSNINFYPNPFVRSGTVAYLRTDRNADGAISISAQQHCKRA
jgi:hypothetical protein